MKRTRADVEVSVEDEEENKYIYAEEEISLFSHSHDCMSTWLTSLQFSEGKMKRRCDEMMEN